MHHSKFYKYRPILSRDQLGFSLDIINDKKLYYSPLNHFNDPFDGFSNIGKVSNSSIKSISLTTNGDSLLLWAYYSGWYRGIQIEFSIDLTSPPFDRLQQVQYTDSMEKLSERINQNDYLTKHVDFAHEEEWRLLFETDQQYLNLDDNKIKSVTLGPALLRDERENLIKSCAKESIEVFEYDVKGELIDVTSKTKVIL